MTAITMAPPATSVPTVVGLRRAVAGEWARTWTVRSTWWGLLAAAVIAMGMGTTFGIDFEGENVPVWVAGEFTIVIAQFPLLVVAMLAVTSDHGTGAIRSSLQWVPRRGVFLTARMFVAILITTVAGVFAALIADITAWLWFRTGLVGSELVSSLTDVAVVVATGAFVTVALATILRSAAGTLTSIFLLLLALPLMLPQFGVPWLSTAAHHLPGMALALLDGLDGPVTRAHIAGVLTVWIVSLTVAAAWVSFRRDAT